MTIEKITAQTTNKVVSASAKTSTVTSTVTSATVLWSTQSGRSKACAKRCSRILRQDYGIALGDIEREQQNSSNGDTTDVNNGIGGCSFTKSNGGGCSSFDDLGPLRLLGLGGGGTSQEDNYHDSTQQQQQPHLLVMFVSTTGDGEHCDSIHQCWKALLSKTLPKNLFSQKLQFALFCLGDRAYGPTAFCAAGRKIAARLFQLGAKPFCGIGYGDDGTPNGGVFGDLEVWLDQSFLPALETKQMSIGRLIGGGGGVKKKNVAQMDPDGCIVASDVRLEAEEQSQSEHVRSTALDEYYTTLAPLNAYQYQHDKKTNGIQRVTPSGIEQDGSNINSIETHDGSATNKKIPLYGNVVINKRITSNDWNQDVRHLRIEVGITNDSFNESCTHHDDNSSSTLPKTKPFLAGDVAVILPQNSSSSVETFLRVLPQSIQRLSNEMLLHIEPTAYSFQQWPEYTTLRSLLMSTLDINGRPEREFLRSLSVFCHPSHPEGIEQAKKLFQLSESEGSSLYADYIIREKRTYADVLYDFDSVCWLSEDNIEPLDNVIHEMKVNYPQEEQHPLLTIEQLLGLIPSLTPRSFSIASSPSDQSDITTSSSNTFGLELCVAVVEGSTPFGRNYEGVCSSFLGRCSVSTDEDNESTLRLWIKPGSFDKLPVQPEKTSSNEFIRFERPVLCIGAGTGIAPLRSLIRERQAIQNIWNSSMDKNNMEITDTIAADSIKSKHEELEQQYDHTLVFGCRTQNADFHYQEEWNHMVSSTSFNLITAFSQENPSRKTYVQQALKRNDGGIWVARHILEQKGSVYIAGSAKMARSVKETIVEILGEVLEGGEKEAVMVLKKLTRLGRFCVEAWS